MKSEAGGTRDQIRAGPARWSSASAAEVCFPALRAGRPAARRRRRAADPRARADRALAVPRPPPAGGRAPGQPDRGRLKAPARLHHGTGEPRPLTEEDVERATLTISRAFAWHEPWGAWALPDPAGREPTLAGIVAADLRGRFLRTASASRSPGSASRSGSRLPPTPAARHSAPRREGELRAYGEQAEVMRAADELIASLQPEGEHWYLDTIATEPARCAGLGGRLLDHDLAAARRRRPELRPRHAHARQRRLLRAPRVRDHRAHRAAGRRAAALRDGAHPAPPNRVRRLETRTRNLTERD